MSKLENVGDIFTTEGKAKLKKGNVLGFIQEGKKVNYKVVSLPGNGNVWVRKIKLTNPLAMRTHHGHTIDTTNETVREFGAPYCSDCEMPISEEAINNKGGENE